MKIRLNLLLGILISLPLVTWSCGDDGKDDEPQPENPGVEVPGEENPGEDNPDVPEAEPLPDYIRPLLTDGKTWIVQNENGCNSGKVFRETVEGDVERNGVIEKKIIHENMSGFADPYDYYMYEENGCVYRFYEKNGTTGSAHWPVFEVDPDKWKKYDTNHALSYANLTIVSKGTMVLMGKTRRAVKLSKSSGSMPYEYWVEGIGPLYWGWAIEYDLEAMPTCVSNWRLLECYDENGEKIYDAEEFSPDIYSELEVFEPAE